MQLPFPGQPTPPSSSGQAAGRSTHVSCCNAASPGRPERHRSLGEENLWTTVPSPLELFFLICKVAGSVNSGKKVSATRLPHLHCLSLSAPTLIPTPIVSDRIYMGLACLSGSCYVPSWTAGPWGMASQQCQDQGEAPRECLAVQEPHLTSPSGCTRWGPRGSGRGRFAGGSRQ